MGKKQKFRIKSRSVLNTTLWICLTVIIFIVSSNSANAIEYCYQETANSSTNGNLINNGNCTQVYTGSYYAHNWTNPQNLYDGSWSTFATTQQTNINNEGAALFVNYSKPSGLFTGDQSAIWQIKTNNHGTLNYSVASCWNGYSDKIVLGIVDTYDIGGNNNYTVKCYDSSNWIELSNIYSPGGGDDLLYEESVIWSSSPSLNITFYDESTNNIINFTTIHLYYSSVISSGDNTTTTGNLIYPSFQPSNYTLTYDDEGSAYFQRSYYLNYSQDSNLSLYLLNNSDGVPVSFTIVNTLGSTITDALVTIRTSINGESQIVSSGTTDAAGSISFFLNPLRTYTIGVTASGYDDYSSSITPTQTTYIITLAGGGTSTPAQSNFNWGITYSVEPKDIILNNNTVYNFVFNISSTYWNLTSYGFYLKNTSNGYIFNTTTGGTPSGSSVSAYLDTDNLTGITMYYFWVIDGNTLNGTRTWQVHPTYQGNFTMMTFFDDLRAFNAAGFDDFGRILISVIIILFATGLLANEFGIYNPTGIATIVVLLCWGLEFVGLIPTIEILGESKKYLISSTLTALLVALYIQENSK